MPDVAKIDVDSSPATGPDTGDASVRSRGRPRAADREPLILDAGPADLALTREALALVVDSIVDANAWWDLARLLPHVERCLSEIGSESAHALDVAVDMAAQRPDCALVAQRIKRSRTA